MSKKFFLIIFGALIFGLSIFFGTSLSFAGSCSISASCTNLTCNFEVSYYLASPAAGGAVGRVYFGDGRESELFRLQKRGQVHSGSKSLSHTYASEGTYKARGWFIALAPHDEASCSTSVTVSITPPPRRPPPRRPPIPIPRPPPTPPEKNCDSALKKIGTLVCRYDVNKNNLIEELERRYAKRDFCVDRITKEQLDAIFYLSEYRCDLSSVCGKAPIIPIPRPIPTPRLSVSCTATPSVAKINQPVVFVAHPQGGKGLYTYSWSGACTGQEIVCQATFASEGTYTANIQVSSDGQTAQSSCQVEVKKEVLTPTPICQTGVARLKDFFEDPEPLTRRAKSVFCELDRNKDGIITSEELPSKVILTKKFRALLPAPKAHPIVDYILLFSKNKCDISPICGEVPKRPPCNSFGDMDNDGFITIHDEFIAERITREFQQATPLQRQRLDVNGDGKITADDAILIKRYAQGLEKTFPVCVKKESEITKGVFQRIGDFWHFITEKFKVFKFE